MMTQEVPHILRCLEEAQPLDEFNASCKEVHDTSNILNKEVLCEEEPVVVSADFDGERDEFWKKPEVSEAVAKADMKPKSIHHAKKWSEEVENLYRFQQAGYRDEVEYKQVKQVDMVEYWPETGFVKKLQRRDNTFYYYDKQRECEDKQVHKVKVYEY